MSDFDISIVIPTFNRKGSLAKVLSAFGEQTYPAEKFEILVVDDGSTDNTETAIRQLSASLPYRLGYFRQSNAGPAKARNKGIDESSGAIIMFTGDDIIPDKNLISEHLKAQKEYPGYAVLGFVGWSSEIEVTDFMRYIAPNGFQFRYNSISDPNNCDFRHFYTSNISLPRKWLENERFDEDFPYAALEDTELAYRLTKKGLKIFFNQKALSYHFHLADLESFCRRMQLTGSSAAILIRKHPELRRLFLPVNIFFAGAIARILKETFFLRRINKKLYWQFQIIAAYIEGLAKAY